MKIGIVHPSGIATIALTVALGASAVGCKASQLTADAAKITVVYDAPDGCENLGVVVGYGGGLTGAYAKPSVNEESAENEVMNQAAALGATHVVLHPEAVDQGDGRGPDYQDTQPAMAHGSGTGSTVTMTGTAYKCTDTNRSTKTGRSIKSGTAFVEVKPPTSISLAPLGELNRITVYRRTPLPSGAGMSEDEVLTVDDQERIQRVVHSLERVAVDPLKYIPTHRVELVGELGVQSLLYGFGYLQYAGNVYRLTDGAFEEVLELREEPEPTESP